MIKKTVLVSLAVVMGLATGAGLRFATRPNVNGLVEASHDALRRRDFAEAERLARQALGRNRSNADAHKVLLTIADAANRPVLRMGVLSSIPDSSPDAFAARLQEANLAFEHGWARHAENIWSRLLDQDPHNRMAFEKLVLLASLRLDVERTLALFRRRYAVARPSLAQLRLFVGAETLEDESVTFESRLRQFLESDPGDVKSRVGLARCFLYQGKSEEAVRLLESAADSLDVEGKIELARAQLRIRDVAAARAQLESVGDANSGDYWMTAGLLHLSEKRLEEAVASLRKAVQLRPLNAEFRSRLIETLRLQGQRRQVEQQSRDLESVRSIMILAKSADVEWSVEAARQTLAYCRQLKADQYIEPFEDYMASAQDAVEGAGS